MSICHKHAVHSGDSSYVLRDNETEIMDIIEYSPRSHKIREIPIIPILVATPLHIFLRKDIIIRMLSLPLLFPSLFCDSLLLNHPLLCSRVLHLVSRLQNFFSFHGEIRELLDLGLVETVDDGVYAGLNEDFLDFLLVFEADLAGGHAAILLEVGPWRVDDGDVVSFVTCQGVNHVYQGGRKDERPSMELALVS